MLLKFQLASILSDDADGLGVGSPWNFGFDIEVDEDFRTGKGGQVADDFLGDLTGDGLVGLFVVVVVDSGVASI